MSGSVLGVLKIEDNHKLQSVTQRVEQCLSVAEPFHPNGIIISLTIPGKIKLIMGCV